MSTGQCLVNSAPVLPTTEQEQADNTCSGPGERARSHRLGVQPRGEHLLVPEALALTQHGGKPGRTIVCADLSAYPCTSPLSNQCRKGQPLLPVHAGNAGHPAPPPKSLSLHQLLRCLQLRVPRRLSLFPLKIPHGQILWGWGGVGGQNF